MPENGSTDRDIAFKVALPASSPAPKAFTHLSGGDFIPARRYSRI